MRWQDIEDGFWLGLLGPSGYLQSKTLREVRGLRADLAESHRGRPPAALDQWDALELEVEAAAARLRELSIEYFDLLVSDLDEETLELALAEVDAKALEVAPAELPFFRAVSEWASAAPGRPSVCGSDDRLVAEVDGVLREVLRGVGRGGGRRADTRLVPTPDQADSEWGWFKVWAQKLAAYGHRPG